MVLYCLKYIEARDHSRKQLCTFHLNIKHITSSDTTKDITKLSTASLFRVGTSPSRRGQEKISLVIQYGTNTCRGVVLFLPLMHLTLSAV